MNEQNLDIIDKLRAAQCALEHVPLHGNVGDLGLTQKDLDNAGPAGTVSRTYYQTQQAWIHIEEALAMLLRSTNTVETK